MGINLPMYLGAATQCGTCVVCGSCGRNWAAVVLLAVGVYLVNP